MAFPDVSAVLPSSVRDRIAPVMTGRWRNAVLGGGALGLALVVVLAVWSSGGSYSVLYAGLSPEEGGRAIADLQKLNIPYQTAESGRVILVPSEELGRARLELAVHGIPKRDGDQWSLLDNESLGVSPFIEKVHYDRAIESALAQTIRQVDGVLSATVKLGLPKQTDFLADSPKPSASVMVRVMPGLTLTTDQVDGIAGLVAASVPGLARDRVTVVDQTGKVLNQRGDEGLQQVPQQLAVARDIERRYETTVTELLVPVLGRGNFRVAVDADLDFSRSKESSIKYGGGHVLSQDETVHGHSAGGEAIGIPGALSNRPPETPTVSAAPENPPAPGQAPNTPEKAAPAPTPDTHRTTNYDLDHTVQYLEHPSWMLRSINVAVLVNHPTGSPLPTERIQSIKTLVATAIGIGDNRHIAVVDLPFEGVRGEVPVIATWWTDPWMRAVEQNAVLALAGLLLLAGGLLPVLRRVNAAAAAMNGSADAAEGPRIGAAVLGAGPQVANDTAIGARQPPRLRVVSADPDSVRSLVISEPDRTAQVIKEWIARDRNRLKQAG